jgi:hypothetical protein
VYNRLARSFPVTPSALICRKLVELAHAYQGRAPPPTLQAVYKAPEAGAGGQRKSFSAPVLDDDDDELEGGSGFDAAGWLDKAREELYKETTTDSVELYLLKSAALVLDNLATLNGLAAVEGPVVNFFFMSIEHGSTLSCQRCSA